MNNHIHWYPGHIAKAERQLKEKLNQVDLVLEILDARIPISSGYQNSEKLTGNKLKIVLLNKSDVADDKLNKIWCEKIEKKYNCPCILTTTKNRKDVPFIVDKILKEAKPVFEKLKARGLLPRPIRVMVIGMPNVGKSSVINKLTGKSKAKTGAKAGVTRNQQWVRVHPQVELLDTPGIIPTVQDDQKKAIKLAMVNSISENAYDNEFVAFELLKILEKNYKKEVMEYYKIDENEFSIDSIAKKRNWIIKGNEPDIQRCSQFILTNFRDGKIGKFTLEKPTDFWIWRIWKKFKQKPF